MRAIGLFAGILALTVSGAASAQDWIVYVSRDSRFAAAMPRQPAEETRDFKTEYSYTIPEHVFTATQGTDRTYRVIVRDYTGVEQLTDVRGSMAFAATAYRQLGRVIFDGYQEIDRIPGHQLTIITPDGRQIYVGLNLYDKRLYIVEANLPVSAPPPEPFRASLQVLDAEGNSIRLNDEGEPAQRRPLDAR